MKSAFLQYEMQPPSAAGKMLSLHHLFGGTSPAVVEFGGAIAVAKIDAPLKHDYFIEDLGQPAGWFKAHRYHYSCLRCGWAFIVEGAGRLRALSEGSEPLSEPENRRRVQTFAEGPCDPPPIEPYAVRAPERAKPPLRARGARKAVRRRVDGIPQILTAR